mmetsp:Transcript_22252/g.53907  ORF Transcript_22252/g.53907 Transcript_22252/m.53907 type:complete len:314 (-) Transcript_22252:251-1192(-)
MVAKGRRHIVVVIPLVCASINSIHIIPLVAQVPAPEDGKWTIRLDLLHESVQPERLDGDHIPFHQKYPQTKGAVVNAPVSRLYFSVKTFELAIGPIDPNIQFLLRSGNVQINLLRDVALDGIHAIEAPAPSQRAALDIQIKVFDNRVDGPDGFVVFRIGLRVVQEEVHGDAVRRRRLARLEVVPAREGRGQRFRVELAEGSHYREARPSTITTAKVIVVVRHRRPGTLLIILQQFQHIGIPRRRVIGARDIGPFEDEVGPRIPSAHEEDERRGNIAQGEAKERGDGDNPPRPPSSRLLCKHHIGRFDVCRRPW